MIKWNRTKLLKELKEEKKRNLISNLEFIDLYVTWIKRTSNKEWSRQQKRIIDEVYKKNRQLKICSLGKRLEIKTG